MCALVHTASLIWLPRDMVGGTRPVDTSFYRCQVHFEGALWVTLIMKVGTAFSLSLLLNCSHRSATTAPPPPD